VEPDASNSLTAIVDEHYEALYRFALSLARNEVEAADLTQQTFFILAQHAKQIRDPAKVKSWLFTTLRREFLHLKRQEVHHPHEEFRPELHGDVSMDSAILRTIDAKAVAEALHSVDPVFRSVLELFYYGGLSYREISEALGVPVGTVMSRLSRGKQQLREVLFQIKSSSSKKIIPLSQDEEASH
jgi:RNA polymerase sigma-70 factor (ECF subfamily)